MIPFPVVMVDLVSTVYVRLGNAEIKRGTVVGARVTLGPAGGAGGAPDAGGAMPPDAGGGAMPPDAGAEGGQLSSEDVVGALQMLVDDGTLQPEEAQQVLDALTGGGAGGDAGAAAGAEGGAMPPDAGAGAAEAGGMQ